MICIVFDCKITKFIYTLNEVIQYLTFFFLFYLYYVRNKPCGENLTSAHRIFYPLQCILRRMVNSCSIAEADVVVIFPKKSMGGEIKGDSIVSGRLMR